MGAMRSGAALSKASSGAAAAGAARQAANTTCAARHAGSGLLPANAAEPALPGRWRCPLEEATEGRGGCFTSIGQGDVAHQTAARHRFAGADRAATVRSEEHTSELQSQS